MGKLIFKYGTMGSGKTLELLVKIYYEKSKNNNVWVWQPDLETGKEIKSRAGLSCKIDCLIPKEKEIDLEDYGDVHLFIDEAQFLTEKQVLALREGSLKYNYNIVCYGLKTDFKGKLFEGSKALIELSDSIIEIDSSCKLCAEKSIFNMRVIDKVPIFHGKQLVSGGDNKYTSVCAKCYFEAKKSLY